MRKTNNRAANEDNSSGGVPGHPNETTIEDEAAESSGRSSKHRHAAGNQEIGEISAPNRTNSRPSIFLRRNPQDHDESDNNEEGHPRQSQRKYPLHAVEEQEVMGYDGAAARGAAVNNSLYQAIPRGGGKIEQSQPKIEIFVESVDDVSGRLQGQGGLYKITPPTTKTDERVLDEYSEYQEKGYGHFTHDREASFGAFCSMRKGFSDLSGFSDLQDDVLTQSRETGAEEETIKARKTQDSEKTKHRRCAPDAHEHDHQNRRCAHDAHADDHHKDRELDTPEIKNEVSTKRTQTNQHVQGVQAATQMSTPEARNTDYEHRDTDQRLCRNSARQAL